MRSGTRTKLLAAAVAAAVAAPASAAGASVGVVSTPNPGTINTIGGLVAFSPTEVWAVGATSSPSYAGCHGRTLTARWTGSVFAEIAAPPTPICASVNGVSGRSTSDIWAVGSTNSARDPHVRHWDGTAWTAGSGAPLPLPPSGGRRLRTTSLNAVTAIASSNVWAVGKAQFADFSRHTLVEHYNGSSWQLVTGPTTTGSELNGISATGASDVWAVGVAGAQTLATHFNGTAWSTVATPNVNALNSLNGVAALAPGNVWAVGSSIKSTTDGVSQSRTLIEHWNGSAWSVVPSPNVGAGNNVLTGVAGHSASDVWAVGYDDDVTGSIPVRKTVWMHWDGTRWTTVPSPNVGTGDNTLTGVIAPAGTTDVWAWGGSAAGTLVERFAR